MKIVLFAASGYGNAVLARLHADGHAVPIVVTAAHDDEAGLRQAGRSFAEEAHTAGVEVLAGVDAARTTTAFDAIAACAPDLLVVVNGYDRTVSGHLARLAGEALYLHPSLLPRYRGPSPSNWALIEGEAETGVTLARLARQNDDGAILAQRALPIAPSETDGMLRARLGPALGDLLVAFCRAPRSHASRTVDGVESTTYPAISRRDGHLRFDQSAVTIARRVRGVTPFPGAFTDVDGVEIDVGCVTVLDASVEEKPGRLFGVDAAGGELIVQARDGRVFLAPAQPVDASLLRRAQAVGRTTPFSVRTIVGRAEYDTEQPDDDELDRYREFPDMVVVAAVYPCNALCPNCPYTPGNSTIRQKYGDAPFMDPALFMKIADECGEAGRRGWMPSGQGAFVRITGGGEPMLHPYGMTRLIEHAKGAGARVYLNTNGSLLTRDDIDRLLACGLDTIEVSVDAGDAATYAIVRKGLDWDRLVETLRTLIDARNRMRGRTLIEVSVINQAAVAGRTEEIERFWRELGVDNVLLRKFLSWGSATTIDPDQSADPIAYLDRDAGVPCPYPFQRLNVDSRGKVEICGFDIDGRTNMGNVREQSLREIWRGAQFAFWRGKHRRGEGGDIPLCAECPDWKYRSWQHNYRKALAQAERRRDAAARC